MSQARVFYCVNSRQRFRWENVHGMGEGPHYTAIESER
jgi:hypothetical protein